MSTIARRRAAAMLAGGLISAGIVAGGVAADPSLAQTRNLADYGSSITAQNSEHQAESKGVPHMDDHRSSPGYFERMNGSGE